ncbi:MAG TPA: hydroxymethylbilane synthase [Chloroflexia bacterium]|nr:hydroxymethylbilane synthase [Chloroflexia bacterium]
MEQTKNGSTLEPASNEKKVPNLNFINKTIIVGTRGSKLALWQTNWLIDRMRQKKPDLKVEIKIFTTQGDRIQDRPLQSVGEDGFFVRELEEALLRGEIDLAIHSLKDLPHQQPEGLVVPATPAREDARDALISRNDLKLEALPQGALIGTSSTRRASQLLAYRPDFRMLPLRGNVDTRMRKLQEGLPVNEAGEQYDAIILATAGLERLSRGKEITEKISYKVMLPAPGQGALAPECRANDKTVLGYLAMINERDAQTAVACEKAFMAALGGGCQTPVGCYAEVLFHRFIARGYVGSPDGSRVIRVELQEDWEGSMKQAEDLGKRLAEETITQGAREILDDARAAGYVTERK